MTTGYFVLIGMFLGIIVYSITKFPAAIGLGVMFGGIGAMIYSSVKVKKKLTKKNSKQD